MGLSGREVEKKTTTPTSTTKENKPHQARCGRKEIKKRRTLPGNRSKRKEELKQMKILVTGANGYLGSGIVKAILDSGNEVVAADFKNQIDRQDPITPS